MNNPVIGIVAKHINIERRKTDSLICDEVKQAIFDNDGIAIGILSPNEEILYSSDDWKQFENKILKEKIIKQLRICNGIILQGGITAEAFENWIASYCYENDIPILGICAGQNSIVRGLGGTTFNIPNPEKHDTSFDEYVHGITIRKDSKFYSIVGKEKIKVNSMHKRSIKNCPHLNMVAFCEDGYPDVVESKKKRFYMGVRFHPECLYKNDQNMNNIFKKFIEECRRQM